MTCIDTAACINAFACIDVSVCVNAAFCVKRSGNADVFSGVDSMRSAEVAVRKDTLFGTNVAAYFQTSRKQDQQVAVGAGNVTFVDILALFFQNNIGMFVCDDHVHAPLS